MNSPRAAVGSYGSVDKAAPRVLAIFNRRHRRLFLTGFLASLRATGNSEVVVPVAVGLYPSEREHLARSRGVQPVFIRETNEHVARRRLRYFAQIVRTLPHGTPIAYWDAGDVLFQSRLDPLWEVVRANPDKILAACEPTGSDYLVNDEWTRSIINSQARRDAQRIISNRPFINSGFLAGSARALIKYFDTVAHWYDTPKLGGSWDPGDQMALNLYCRSNLEDWRQIPESWNYCLCGRNRKTFRCFKDGRFVDVRGVPIYVVHGNARTLSTRQLIRRPF
jgi:hypothetical protein